MDLSAVDVPPHFMPVQASPFPVNPVTNKIYVGSMASFGSAITVIDGATNSTNIVNGGGGALEVNPKQDGNALCLE